MTSGGEASYSRDFATDPADLPPCRPLNETAALERLETECARLRLLLGLAEAPNLRGSLGWEPEPFVRLPGMLPVQEVGR